MITALFLALLAYSTFGPHGPNPGTFTAFQDGLAIVRMDTRTGTFERCTAPDGVLTCAPVVAK